MNVRSLLLLTPVLLALAGVAAAGGPLGLFGGGKGHGGGLVHCDKSCDHCPCYPTIEEVTVKKPCYEVECEQICVPKVRLPWPLFGGLSGKVKGCDCLRGCSGTQCGHVKTIRVLKVESRECVECRCNWDACGKGGCGKGCGGVQKVGSPLPVEPTAAGDMHGDDIPPPPAPTAARPTALIEVRHVR